MAKEGSDNGMDYGAMLSRFETTTNAYIQRILDVGLDELKLAVEEMTHLEPHYTGRERGRYRHAMDIAQAAIAGAEREGGSPAQPRPANAQEEAQPAQATDRGTGNEDQPHERRTARRRTAGRSGPWGNHSRPFREQLQAVRNYTQGNEGEEPDRLRIGIGRLDVLFVTYNIGEEPSSQVSARQSIEARNYRDDSQRRLTQIENENRERRQRENRDRLWGTKYRPIAHAQALENAHQLIRAVYESEMRAHADIYGNIEEPEILDNQTAALVANVRRVFDNFENELRDAKPTEASGIIRKYDRRTRTVMAAGGAANLTAADRLLNLRDWLFEDAWFR